MRRARGSHSAGRLDFMRSPACSAATRRRRQTRRLPSHAEPVQLCKYPADVEPMVVGPHRHRGRLRISESEHFTQPEARRDEQRHRTAKRSLRPNHSVLAEPGQPPIRHRVTQPQHHSQAHRLQPARPIQQLHDLPVPFRNHRSTQDPSPASRQSPDQAGRPPPLIASQTHPSRALDPFSAPHQPSRPGPPDPSPRPNQVKLVTTHARRNDGCVWSRAPTPEGPASAEDRVGRGGTAVYRLVHRTAARISRIRNGPQPSRTSRKNQA